MSEEYRARSRNAVLVKDDVGRAKATIYDLPADGHAYGHSEPPDLEGAREVTMHWAAHVPRRKAGPECQDFRKLNRLAATNGVTNAGQLKEWRASNDVKLVPKGPEGALPCVIPSDVIASFAYGRKSRPSTPIHSVIGGQYAAEQEDSLALLYQKHSDEQDMPNGKRRIKLTLAARKNIMNARANRAIQAAGPEPKEEWKMSKFKNVQGKMSQLGASASAPSLKI